MVMDKVKISTFKAGCIAMLNNLKRKNSKPFVVTSRGEPIAVIYPFKSEKTHRILGGQLGSVICDSDFSGTDFSSDWEALQD